ncbi:MULTISPECIES: serine/threonine-protein kinase [Protofrankia]|uniref:Serine/threonine protein kinase n=1 Tax=Candidatus Protofrankia datiscae TaxID=2716812 RepID=F8B131_9ACTN|nr:MULTISPECIES: serine/threonine-protein kinase [Protofrankia]AEH07663.1 serine/threonine protein kinase [Candidatus Protofrankia datiscae]
MLAPLAADDPRSVGPYRLYGRLGEGGMGVVYQAFAPDDTPVAIKLPHLNVAADPEFRARFRQEVTAARRVRGAFVAEVLDADVDAPRPWMATAYVDGVSLADAVRRRGRLDGPTLMSLAVGLAEALVVIHAAGVVHRDLKPANIIMDWNGPKVIDFGIARLSDATMNTRTGFSIGTVAWMAPEQLSGERAGPAADIFAWGACVAFAATGRHPFAAATPAASMARVLGDAPDLEGVPEPFASVIARALAKSPAQRCAAVDAVASLTGRQIYGVTDAERVATRVSRGGLGLNDASAGGPFGPPQPSAGRGQEPGWPGWQTPPPPPETGRTRVGPPLPPWEAEEQPVQGGLWDAQPPSQPPPSGADRHGILTPPGPPQQGRFGRSSPMPVPVLAVLLAAAVLTAIPLISRASTARTPTIIGGYDIWDVFGELTVAFLALPVMLVGLVVGNRWGAWRDFAAGCVVGLSVMSIAELGFAQEEFGSSPDVGGWLIVTGAAAALVVVLGWRGWTAGWTFGRWAVFCLLVGGMGIAVFASAELRWKAYVLAEQPSLVGMSVIGGVLLLATLFAQPRSVTLFTAVIVVGLCAFEMFHPDLYVYAVDNFAVLIGLLTLGLLGDRWSDRLFLFASRVAVAVALLRHVVLAWGSGDVVIRLGETILDLSGIHLAAFGAIAVLAALGTLRGPRVVPGPWQPPPPSYPPGPLPYRAGRPY